MFDLVYFVFIKYTNGIGIDVYAAVVVFFNVIFTVVAIFDFFQTKR